MPNIESNILDGSNPASIEIAVATLLQDGLVAIPTETVYGLAARASSHAAIQKIFTVKGRPPTHPLILHIAKVADLELWTKNLTSAAKLLTKRYWPGPLTVIVDRRSTVCDKITGGRDTVAVRCPDNKIAIELINRLGDAIVAPSANRFGKVSPTSAQHVYADLGQDVEIILDGGKCSVGLESTIIDCTTTPPQLLRAGAITVEQIERDCAITIAPASGESRSSGMLEKHYAPNCKVELFKTRSLADSRQFELTQAGVRAEVLDFDLNLELYARNLYSQLRDADFRHINVVIVVMAPMTGIGLAINDRLKKAANSH